MPVQKFRSVQDMPAVPAPSRTDEETWYRIARLWRRAALLDPGPNPRGVFKYRSIDEARRAREDLAHRRQAKQGGEEL